VEGGSPPLSLSQPLSAAGHIAWNRRGTKNRHREVNSTITQAEIFHDFMRAVWENAIKDENGNTKYNEYSDARSVAETMGAKVVARVDDWNNWLFPDGSTVEISDDGSSINKAPP